MFNIFICIAEAFLFLFFMNIFFPLKVKKISSYLFSILLAFALYQTLQMSFFIDSQYFLLSLGAYILISLCLYHKEDKVLATSCIYFSVLYLLQILIFNLQYQFFHSYDFMIIKVIPIIIISILIFIIYKETFAMKQKLNSFHKSLFTRSALLLLLSVSFLYSAIIVLIESTASYQFLLIFMELIGIIFLLFSISKEYKHTQDNVMNLKQQEQLIQMKNENQEVKAQNDLDLMHIRHEMKNQILTLEYLLKEKKYQETSDFIEGLHSDSLYKKSIYTNNEVINAICNNKIYHHPDIHFDFQMQFEQLNIDNHELISLIGNALDNAIDYLDQLDQEKKLSLSIQQTKDFYIFIIKNSIHNHINTDLNHLTTTKDDKEHHGFGIKIMKDIVEKHQGTFEISIENHTFIVSMLIPITQ